MADARMGKGVRYCGILVGFLRFAHQHDSSTGEAMRRLWEDAELPQLLEEYLNR